MTEFPTVPQHIADAFQTAIIAAIAQPHPPDNTTHAETYLREIEAFCTSPSCDEKTATYLYITVYDQLINLWAITARLKCCPELIKDAMIDREREVTIWLNGQLKMYLATKPT